MPHDNPNPLAALLAELRELRQEVAQLRQTPPPPPASTPSEPPAPTPLPRVFFEHLRAQLEAERAAKAGEIEAHRARLQQARERRII